MVISTGWTQSESGNKLVDLVEQLSSDSVSYDCMQEEYSMYYHQFDPNKNWCDIKSLLSVAVNPYPPIQLMTSHLPTRFSLDSRLRQFQKVRKVYGINLELL